MSVVGNPNWRALDASDQTDRVQYSYIRDDGHCSLINRLSAVPGFTCVYVIVSTVVVEENVSLRTARSKDSPVL